MARSKSCSRPIAAGLAILLALGVGVAHAAETAPPAGGTREVTLDDLPGMVLSEADVGAELAGSLAAEARSIPNEVKANTGGDGEPVTLDDPEYGDELARLDGWGRLGGYEVTFTREVPLGEPNEVEVGLELVATESGAHDFYAGWYGSEPDGCLEVGDESDCPSGLGILLRAADGTEELLTSRSATFRIGRIIGDVTIWARSEPEDEPGPRLEGLARTLALRLFEKVAAGPTASPAPTTTQAAADGPEPEPAASSPSPIVLEAAVLEALCRENAADRRTRSRCMDIVRTVLAPEGTIVVPVDEESESG